MAASTLQLAQPFLIEQDYGKYTPEISRCGPSWWAAACRN